MTWPDDISQDFPALRDDEPATLRHDIVDELSDHLQCAHTRELHLIGDATKAKQNVLERFGNPARVAYRLWFDAMKEKIVSQRIVVGASVVMTAACLFAGYLAWQAAARAEQASLVLIEQGWQANEALLEKLTTLAPQPPRSMDWSSVKVRLVTGTPDGPPAVGFRAHLVGYPRPADSVPELVEASSDDGVLDFGFARPGKYMLQITAPWKAALNGPIAVRPGKDFEKTIVCPSRPAVGDVAIEVEWPDELRDTNLAAHCSFVTAGWDVGDFVWQAKDNDAMQEFVCGNFSEPADESRPIDNWQKASGFTWKSHANSESLPALALGVRPWRLFAISFHEKREGFVGLATLGDRNVDQNQLDLPDPPQPEILVCSTYDFTKSDAKTCLQRFFIGPDQKTWSENVPASNFEVKPGKLTKWKVVIPKSIVAPLKEEVARVRALAEKQNTPQ
jgi:hypothetical protein